MESNTKKKQKEKRKGKGKGKNQQQENGQGQDNDVRCIVDEVQQIILQIKYLVHEGDHIAAQGFLMETRARHFLKEKARQGKYPFSCFSTDEKRRSCVWRTVDDVLEYVGMPAQKRRIVVGKCVNDHFTWDTVIKTIQCALTAVKKKIGSSENSACAMIVRVGNQLETKRQTGTWFLEAFEELSRCLSKEKNRIFFDLINPVIEFFKKLGEDTLNEDGVKAVKCGANSHFLFCVLLYTVIADTDPGNEKYLWSLELDCKGSVTLHSNVFEMCMGEVKGSKSMIPKAIIQVKRIGKLVEFLLMKAQYHLHVQGIIIYPDVGTDAKDLATNCFLERVVCLEDI